MAGIPYLSGLNRNEMKIEFSSRRSGKSEYMRKEMNRILDNNPDAKIGIASIDMNGNPQLEIIENAEFEEVTNLL